MQRQINAQIRYYYKIDPTTLTDDEWAMMWQDLKWIRQKEAAESINKIL